MNETSATSASGLSLLPDGIATLTAIHFTIIAVLAVLVVIGLIWGIRAKRSRVQASRDVIANAEEAGVPPEPIASTPVTTANRVAAPSQSQVQTPPAASTPDASAPPRAEEPKRETAPAPASMPSPASGPIVETSHDPASSPMPSPAPVPSAEPVPVEPSAPQAGYAEAPVTQLKGLGPKVAARLAELGVTTIGQMAALSDGDAQAIDANLGSFTGRMHRDRWIEQARLLAGGDKAGFEAVFGKL